MRATRKRPAGTAAISLDRRVLRLDNQAGTLLYLAVILAVLASGLLIVTLWLLSQTISKVFLGHQHLAHLLPFLGAMLVLVTLRASLIWNSEFVSQHASSRIKATLRDRLSEKLFALGPAQTHRERSGELVHTLVEGVESLDEYITGYQPARLLAGLIPVLILAVVMLLDPLTVLVLLFAGPMLVLLLAVIGAQTKELSLRRFLELSWMSAHFLDMVQGLATLKMFGRSREQVETIEDISQDFAGSTMGVLRTTFQTSLMLEWAAVGATAFVALEVSLRLMQGTLPFATALTVLLLTPEFFLPLRQLALKYHAGATGKAGAERIFALLDSGPMPVPVLAPVMASATAPSATGLGRFMPVRDLDVRFENVHFSYDGRTQPALQDVTLTLHRARTTALVGPTGAGKTTLAALLLRFIEPSSGTIWIGDTPLDHLDPATCRLLVGWVPQHPHFFHGTIADNILLARPDASEADMVAAARAAHAHEFIQTFPEGYGTTVHENGARLSGGQRQRIAIARAFLKNASILILDEATAHLDAASEALVQESLRELMRGRTTLIIAHRLTMAYGADQIVVMDQGRVVEIGTHQRLLAKGTLYHAMVSQYQETVA
ncbi:MAG: thiol reductant ABC exporter subunit CydD [Ktedonobacterales bacterium]